MSPEKSKENRRVEGGGAGCAVALVAAVWGILQVGSSDGEKAAPKPQKSQEEVRPVNCNTFEGILRLNGVTLGQMESVNGDKDKVSPSTIPGMLRERSQYYSDQDVKDINITDIKVYIKDEVDHNTASYFYTAVNNHFMEPWAKWAGDKLIDPKEVKTDHVFNIGPNTVAQVAFIGSEVICR